jgi:hypothetical protein
MPLIKSASKKAVGPNISRELSAGKDRKQAIAIALSVQRRAAGNASRSIASKRQSLPSTGLPGLKPLGGLGVNLLKRPRSTF